MARNTQTKNFETRTTNNTRIVRYGNLSPGPLFDWRECTSLGPPWLTYFIESVSQCVDQFLLPFLYLSHTQHLAELLTLQSVHVHFIKKITNGELCYLHQHPIVQYKGTCCCILTKGLQLYHETCSCASYIYICMYVEPFHALILNNLNITTTLTKSISLLGNKNRNNSLG